MRRFAAFLLVFALVGPLVAVAQESEDEGPPFWKVLRPRGSETARWTTADLNAVHFPSNDRVGYAVGNSGRVLKTTDGGDSWEVWTLRSGAASIGTLRSVHFVDEQVGFAVGDGGLIVRTPDGGANWVKVSSPVGVGLNAVYFPPQPGVPLEDLVGYAGGGNENTGFSGACGGELYRVVIIKTTDGGKSWKQLSTPCGLGYQSYSIYSFSFPNGADTGAAVGGGGSSGVTLRTTNGGGTWAPSNALSNLQPARDVAILPDLPAGSPGSSLNGVGYAAGSKSGTSLSGDSIRRSTDGFAGATSERGVNDLRGIALYREGEAEHAHAVGLVCSGTSASSTCSGNDPFPVVLTRNVRENQIVWDAELIEEWSSYKGKALYAVDASPPGQGGHRTVVAVGQSGMMIRRSTATGSDTVCVPFDTAQTLKEAGVDLSPTAPICPQKAPTPTPEDKQAPGALPPKLLLSPTADLPGEQLTISGSNWRQCTPPGSSDCTQSSVELTFVDPAGASFSLGTVQAGPDGAFATYTVTVPPEAAVGTGKVRGVGNPQPDGGATAEASFTVLPPPPIRPAPSISVPSQVELRQDFTLSGQDWRACQGYKCVGSKVQLTFRQDHGDFPLGTAKADSEGNFVNFTVTVPAEAVPGGATVTAVGDPVPNGGATAEGALKVLTECRITVEQTNPEFPCIKSFVHFKNENGTTLDPYNQPVGWMQFDPGLGEGDGPEGPHGRVVAVGTHIFLYDLIDLEQGGGAGFRRRERRDAAAPGRCGHARSRYLKAHPLPQWWFVVP